MSTQRPRIAVFGPDPLLAVAVEKRPGGGDEIHLHAGGQGVWVSRMAAELGGDPVLCAFAGGEAGQVLRGLLGGIELRLAHSAEPSGSYVVDRREDREMVAHAWSEPHSRHEVDDLLSLTCAAALDADIAVVCNPYPAESLPVSAYSQLVGDLRDAGAPVLVDLSTPRLDAALEGCPDIVKLNDWELAEYVSGPVEGPALEDAAEQIRSRGAGTVVVTRGGGSAVAFTPEGRLEIVPPVFVRGHREGCGDAMTGAMAVALGRGEGLGSALALGAAAGAANFLRRGLGSAEANVVETLVPRVSIRPYGSSPRSSAAGAAAAN